MQHKIRNIVLIGMPGVGKSTVGVILAKELGYQFLDTDICIQQREDCLLKDLIAVYGVDGFIAIENQFIASIDVQGCVIATGGSAVYGRDAMEHLKEIGTIIYLKLPYEELKYRLGNLKGRGVVLKSGQTLKHIFAERCILYEMYADYVIDESNLDVEKTLQKILNLKISLQKD